MGLGRCWQQELPLPPCHPHPPEYPSITSINCSCSCINPLSYHFQWYQRTLDFSFCTITAPYYYSFLSSLTNSHSSPYTILVVQLLLLLAGMGAGEAPLPPLTMHMTEHSFPLLGVLQLSWLQPPRPAQHPIMTAYSIQQWLS